MFVFTRIDLVKSCKVFSESLNITDSHLRLNDVFKFIYYTHFWFLLSLTSINDVSYNNLN